MKKLRLLLLITGFVTVNSFAQETVMYFKNDKKVSEEDDWDNKMVQTHQKNSNNEVFTTEVFSKGDTLKSKVYQELSNDMKSGKSITEFFYPEQQCKSVSETVAKNENVSTTSKCIGYDGKVIFTDKDCVEKGSDAGLSNWIKDNIANKIFDPEDGDVKYYVEFMVTPQYNIEVKKIYKSGEPKDTDLTSNATKKRIKEAIETIPQRIFEGRLMKIAGKETDTTYKVPIYYYAAD